MAGSPLPYNEPDSFDAAICQVENGSLWRRVARGAPWYLIHCNEEVNRTLTWDQLQTLKPVRLFVESPIETREPRAGGSGIMICVIKDDLCRFFVRLENMSGSSFPWVDVTAYCDDDGPTEALSWQQIIGLGGKIIEVFNPADYLEELRNGLE